MNIIFQIDGGIGKNIAATAVCRAIKNQYPDGKLIVITAYPDVFLCNPHVYRAFTHTDLSYFYSDYIAGSQVKVFAHDPYFNTAFINEDGHLIKVWCEMFGIAYTGEQPELFLTERERDFYHKHMQSDKPVLVVQTNGGPADQASKYSWPRDLPISTAQQLVDAYRHDYHIVHIRRPNQFSLRNTVPVTLNSRALFALIERSDKRLFIDSFAQHAAAALDKPSVVCWIGNKPSQFGYELHTNIIANEPAVKPELRRSVYSKYNIGGEPMEFPYKSETDVFDIDILLEALAEIKPTWIKAEKADASAISMDMNIRRKIVRAVEHESMVAKRLMHVLGKADLTNIRHVLDIGSWHLQQSIEFATIFENARIDAFEPVPASYNLCNDRLQTLDKQKKERIHLHNIAFSNKIATVPFYIVQEQEDPWIDVGYSSLFKFDEYKKNELFGAKDIQHEISVTTDTLDNWCAENDIKEIDLLWMDVQGAELLVFNGAETILESTKIIMTEVGLQPYYNGHALKPDIDAFLRRKGFNELEEAYEVNIPEYEVNTIYIKN